MYETSASLLCRRRDLCPFAPGDPGPGSSLGVTEPHHHDHVGPEHRKGLNPGTVALGHRQRGRSALGCAGQRRRVGGGRGTSLIDGLAPDPGQSQGRQAGQEDNYGQERRRLSPFT